MADALKQEFDLDAVTLVSGARGEFSVWLGETMLVKKSFRGFPTSEDTAQALRAALRSADGLTR